MAMHNPDWTTAANSKIAGADSFADALLQYQAVLASDPNRFNALLGAARAAKGLGERDVAANYYGTLLAN